MNHHDDDFRAVEPSRVYGCFSCRNFVAVQDDIVLKDFVSFGEHRAFLFSHVKNVREGPAVDKELISGKHTVSDVFCSDCGEYLGWKYVKVYRNEHEFKLGKTVIVKYKIAKVVNP